VLCSEYTLVKEFGQFTEAVALPCRSWRCQHCAPIRKRQLIAKACRGQPTTLLTLTVNPHRLDSPHERAVALSHAWRRLRRAIISKRNLEDLPFIAVFERHKSGEPHLHILMRAPFIPQRWIAGWMKAELGAPVVDIRRIWNPKRAAYYVAKYVGKDPERFDGCKRYWSSQDYELPDDQDPRHARPEPRAQYVEHQRLADLCRDLEKRGLYVIYYEGGALIQSLEEAFKRR